MEARFVVGRVVRGLGGRYEIFGDDGVTYTCRAKGSLRRDGDKLLIGDIVTLRVTSSETDDVVVEKIHPRKNSLIRPPLANLDKLFLVVAAAEPDFAPETADKMLAIAEFHGMEPAVIVTKEDKSPEAAEKIADVYRKAGYETFVLSAQSEKGVEQVRQAVLSSLQGGKIGAFAGASGVGKSTLIGKLFPFLAPETGEISQKTGRGRHTTRSVDLFSPQGTDGYLADTPGFSLLDFERFDFFPLESLVSCFRDIAPYAKDCRWGDCTHVGESEGDCAVKRAVAEGRIAPSRHATYAALRQILKTKENTYK